MINFAVLQHELTIPQLYKKTNELFRIFLNLRCQYVNKNYYFALCYIHKLIKFIKGFSKECFNIGTYLQNLSVALINPINNEQINKVDKNFLINFLHNNIKFRIVVILPNKSISAVTVITIITTDFILFTFRLKKLYSRLHPVLNLFSMYLFSEGFFNILFVYIQQFSLLFYSTI